MDAKFHDWFRHSKINRWVLTDKDSMNITYAYFHFFKIRRLKTLPALEDKLLGGCWI
jgi:hypothetical protein